MAQRSTGNTTGKAAVEVTHLGDLTPDPRNARRHNPRNVGMLVEALNEVGAARSIVIDEAGVVLAGNATIKAAAEAGITRVLTVDADGETLVAVRRTGLSPEAKTRLALFDNRVAELADWSPEVLEALKAEGLTGGMFTDDEMAGLTNAPPDVEFKEYDESIADDVKMLMCPHCGGEFPQ
jgi:hypothetical protein